MINISDLDKAKLDYHGEIIASLEEAKNYLAGFEWCFEIKDGWLAASWGYILSIFYFNIQPDNNSCQDEYIWIIVGDLPPTYIDVITAPTAFDALESYIRIMQEWVDNVFSGKSVEDCYSINVPPRKEYAEMLNGRLELLRKDFLPALSSEQIK